MSQFRQVKLPPSHQSGAPSTLNRGFPPAIPAGALSIHLARYLHQSVQPATRNQSPQGFEDQSPEMGYYSNSGPASGVAQVFIGFLKPTDSNLGESGDEEGASLMQAVRSGESFGG